MKCQLILEHIYYKERCTDNCFAFQAKIEVYIRVLKPSESSSRSVIDSHHVAHHVPLNHVGFPSHPAFRTFSRPPQRPFPPSPREPTATKRPAQSTSLDALVTPGQNNGSSKMSVSEIEIPHQQNDHEITPVLFPVIATVAFAPVALVILWLIHRRCRMQEKTAAVSTSLSCCKLDKI